MTASDKVSDRATDRAYVDKTDQYFVGVRQDFLDSLPTTPGLRILEIGRAALEAGRSAKYVGVELFEKATAIVRKHLTRVIAGDVETLDLPWTPGHFDAVVMSEVREHLVDPWRAAAQIVPLIRGSGLIIASSPNIAQIRTVRNLLAGRWELADSGVMDRAHLRWFTPKSYREMFERAGVTVDSVTPLSPASRLGKVFNTVTFGQFAYLTMRQIVVTGRAPMPGTTR